MRRIFDGHLDLSWNALSWDRDITLELDDLNRLEQGLDDHPARGRATTTLPEMRRGGVALCQATLLARAKSGLAHPRRHQPAGPRLRQPGDRLGDGTGPARLLRAARAPGLVADDPHRRRSRCPLEKLGRRRSSDADRLHPGHGRGRPDRRRRLRPRTWWDLGLRSVNLAHYGKSRYAVGTGDDGPLTADGVAACSRNSKNWA